MTGLWHDVLKNEKIRAIILESGLALLLFIWDPFNLSAQQSLNFDKWYAIATQFLHGNTNQDKLAVVLIDQAALDGFHHDWPLPYRTIAGIGDRIACAGAIGIFFDLALSRKYNLSEGADDILTMTDSQQSWPVDCPDGSPTPNRHIPVFFGRIPNIDTPLATAVSSSGRDFLIETHSEYNTYAAGREEFNNSAPGDDEVTPAFGLFRWFCGKSAGQRNLDKSWCPTDTSPATAKEPIYLTWNGNGAPGQTTIANGPDCQEHSTAPYTDAFESFWSPRGRRCAPILTLHATDLYRDFDFIQKNNVDPRHFLNGRIVFVGVDLPGLKDEIRSPVYDLLPGVFVHAVALDNLLTYGARYPTTPNPRSVWVFAGLFFLLINLCINTFFAMNWKHSLKIGRAEINLAPLIGLMAVILLLFSFCVAISWLRWPFSLIITLTEYIAGSEVIVAILASTYRHRGRKHHSGA